MQELAGICGWGEKEMAGLGLVELLGNLSLQKFTLPPAPLHPLIDLQSPYVFYIQVYLSMDSLRENIL